MVLEPKTLDKLSSEKGLQSLHVDEANVCGINSLVGELWVPVWLALEELLQIFLLAVCVDLHLDQP